MKAIPRNENAYKMRWAFPLISTNKLPREQSLAAPKQDISSSDALQQLASAQKCVGLAVPEFSAFLDEDDRPLG